MQMRRAGLGEEMSQTDGAAGGGGSRKLSSRWWMRAVAGARRPSLSHWDRILWPPELHYHDTVTSTHSFGWECEHDWGSRAGSCKAGLGSVARHRQRGLLGSHPAAEAPSGNWFSSGTTATLLYASCWRLTDAAFCQWNANATVWLNLFPPREK